MGVTISFCLATGFLKTDGLVKSVQARCHVLKSGPAEARAGAASANCTSGGSTRGGISQLRKGGGVFGGSPLRKTF